jgi:hypothetical protein
MSEILKKFFPCHIKGGAAPVTSLPQERGGFNPEFHREREENKEVCNGLVFSFAERAPSWLENLALSHLVPCRDLFKQGRPHKIFYF